MSTIPILLTITLGVACVFILYLFKREQFLDGLRLVKSKDIEVEDIEDWTWPLGFEFCLDPEGSYIVRGEAELTVKWRVSVSLIKTGSDSRLTAGTVYKSRRLEPALHEVIEWVGLYIDGIIPVEEDNDD